MSQRKRVKDESFWMLASGYKGTVGMYSLNGLDDGKYYQCKLVTGSIGYDQLSSLEEARNLVLTGE